MQANARNRVARALLLATAATLGSAGCLSDFSALSIDGFKAINIGDGTCEAGDFISGGTLDTTRSTGYTVGMMVNNGMVASEDPLSGVIEARTVTIAAAEVSYRTSVGAPFAPPPPETIALSVTIPPGELVNLVVPLLTAANGASLEGASGGQLVATVRLRGRTPDGAAVTSVASEFPIALCDGCLKLACEEDEFGPDGQRLLKEGFTRAYCTPESAGQPGGVQCANAD